VADPEAPVVIVARAETPIAHLLEAGTAVVLVDPDAEALGRVARAAGPGARLALFVGDPEEGSVRVAAEIMGVELFGFG
jgi:hypothetical protein